jgi:hypothetical protein
MRLDISTTDSLATTNLDVLMHYEITRNAALAEVQESDQ